MMRRFFIGYLEGRPVSHFDGAWHDRKYPLIFVSINSSQIDDTLTSAWLKPSLARNFRPARLSAVRLVPGYLFEIKRRACQGNIVVTRQ